MKILTVKFAYLSLPLLLLLWFDRCESLTDSSLPGIFFPFGRDQEDRVVTPGNSSCGNVHSPYTILNHKWHDAENHIDAFDRYYFVAC